jgi:hypothetical protein
MQAGPPRSTWIERWREPFDAPHWVRICLTIGLVGTGFAVSSLLWGVVPVVILDAVARQFDAEALQRLVQSGYLGAALPLGRWLTGSSTWLGDPLQLGFLACVIAFAGLGVFGGRPARKSATHVLLLVALAAAAGLLIGLCCGIPLAKVGVTSSNTPQAAGGISLLFAALCAAGGVMWVTAVVLLSRAGLPYPTALLLFSFMVRGWMVDLTMILRLAGAGIYTGLEATSAVFLSGGAFAVIGCAGGVLALLWARNGGLSSSAQRWATLRDRAIPIMASVVLTAAAAAAVGSVLGALVRLSAIPDGPQIAMQIAKAWAGFLGVLAAVVMRPVFTLLSALVMLLLAVPSEPRDARGYVAEIRT